MSYYDVIGAGEALVSGPDEEWNEVDSLLSGYDLIGARQMRGQPSHTFGRAGHQAPTRQVAYHHALAAAAAQKQANAGVIVRTQAPTRARRQLLNLVSTGTIGAGAAATITARPQTIAFKPDRVIVPSSIGPDFTIQDIKVGNQSQFVQSGEMSAECFGPLVTESLLDFDTVQTSQDFVMQCQNISGAARTFRATVFGKSVSQ